MKRSALEVTSQSLAIVSQLLAIGIEVGLLAGGVYVYKKLTTKPVQETAKPAEEPLCTAVAAKEKEASFKERWDKLGRIFKAVVG